MCDKGSRMDGKVVIITGGATGMGFEAAKDIANRGARVIIASRNETRLKDARDNIREATGNDNVDYRLLDLASLTSVRNFAQETIAGENRLDVLFNNAGAVGLPDRFSEDGNNMILQVNYIGPFLLTYLLLPLIRASKPSRILNTSTLSMFLGSLDFDHWNDIGRYSELASTGNYKLAMTMFTAELNYRFGSEGVSANGYDPYLVKGTEIFKSTSPWFRSFTSTVFNGLGRTVETAGKEIAYMASDPRFEKESGGNYMFCRSIVNHWYTRDRKLTKRLWDETKKLAKVKPEEEWDLENNNVVKS